ncbi:MAG: hypothetical protein ACYSWU_23980 [Planctomycetota bacterium]|jgi:hypothetical protein
MQVQVLSGLFDELEKISARRASAGFMQTRSGRRPIRASTLLAKPQLAPDSSNGANPSVEPDAPMADMEPAVEGTGPTDAGEKVAKLLTKERKEKALEGVATARPYVVSGVKGAVPGALIGKVLFEGGKGRLAGHAGRTGAILGGAMGVTHEALQRWAEKHKRKAVAKKLLEE